MEHTFASTDNLIADARADILRQARAAGLPFPERRAERWLEAWALALLGEEPFRQLRLDARGEARGAPQEGAPCMKTTFRSFGS